MALFALILPDSKGLTYLKELSSSTYSFLTLMNFLPNLKSQIGTTEPFLWFILNSACFMASSKPYM